MYIKISKARFYYLVESGTSQVLQILDYKTGKCHYYELIV